MPAARAGARSEGHATRRPTARAWLSDIIRSVSIPTPRASFAQATAADAKQRDLARAEAARQFIQFRSRDDQAIEQVLAIITPRTSPEAAAGLIESLGGSQAAEAGKLIARRLPSLAPSARAAGLRVMISRAEWTETLLDELRDGKLPLGELSPLSATGALTGAVLAVAVGIGLVESLLARLAFRRVPLLLTTAFLLCLFALLVAWKGGHL